MCEAIFSGSKSKIYCRFPSRFPRRFPSRFLRRFPSSRFPGLARFILTEKNRWFLVSLLSRSQKLESQQNSQQICWVGRAHSDRKKPMLFVLTLKRIEKNRDFLNLTGRVAFRECRDRNRMAKVSEILGRNSLSRIPSEVLDGDRPSTTKNFCSEIVDCSSPGAHGLRWLGCHQLQSLLPIFSVALCNGRQPKNPMIGV